MGYLTPIVFRNDSSSILDKEPEQVIEAIRNAMRNTKRKEYSISYFTKPKWWQFWQKNKWSGADLNPILSMGTRHADDMTIFVFCGNTMFDLGSMTWHPEEFLVSDSGVKLYEKLIKITESNLKDAKRILKNWKEKSK